MKNESFENVVYDFAKDKKQQSSKRLKIASIFLGILILLFAMSSLLGSLQFFPQITTRLNKPIDDRQTEVDKVNQEYQQKIEAYSLARIPYRDPAGRFAIEFATPYVSSEIVVYIKTNQNQAAVKEEVESIIQRARSTVEITRVQYINDY